MFKPSGNPKVFEITKSCKDRRTNLDQLRPIIVNKMEPRGYGLLISAEGQDPSPKALVSKPK
ncbi:MAG TPA: hypothetical protein VIJ14_02675, partial [Rhabdochlamydiaceae bacterium]